MDQSLSVNPAELRGAAEELEQLADEAQLMLSALRSALEQEGPCWGHDEPGTTFAHTYEPDADRGVDGLRNLAGKMRAAQANAVRAAHAFEDQDGSGKQTVQRAGRNVGPDLPGFPSTSWAATGDPGLGPRGGPGVGWDSGLYDGRRGSGALPDGAGGGSNSAGAVGNSAPCSENSRLPGTLGSSAADGGGSGTAAPLENPAPTPAESPAIPGDSGPQPPGTDGSSTPNAGGSEVPGMLGDSTQSVAGSHGADSAGPSRDAQADAESASGQRAPDQARPSGYPGTRSAPNAVDPAETPWSRNPAGTPWSRTAGPGEASHASPPRISAPKPGDRPPVRRRTPKPGRTDQSTRSAPVGGAGGRGGDSTPAPRAQPRERVGRGRGDTGARALAQEMAARHELEIVGFDSSAIGVETVREIAAALDFIRGKYPVELRGIEITERAAAQCYLEDRCATTSSGPVEPWIVLSAAAAADPALLAPPPGIGQAAVHQERPMFAAVVRELGAALEMCCGPAVSADAQRELICQYLRLDGPRATTLARVVDGYRRWRARLGPDCFHNEVFAPGRALAVGFAAVELTGVTTGPAKVLHRLLVTRASAPRPH